MGPVHNQMPVILPQEAEATWPSSVIANPAVPTYFFRPYPTKAMQARTHPTPGESTALSSVPSRHLGSGEVRVSQGLQRFTVLFAKNDAVSRPGAPRKLVE